MISAQEVEAAVDFERLTAEAVELLREYVRIDTSNPPGDVSQAAGWVERVLAGEGVAATRLGPSSAKANVVATLGDGAGRRPFVLAHHMDVVPADRGDWAVDPFAAEVRDGFVWGRGTLDMKGFGAMSLACALTIKRLGLPLSRPLRLLATADEEVGGMDGARWLAENHLDEAGGEYLLTEGSFARAGPRATYYAVQVAEKGVSTARLVARGQGGHASQPREDNALVRIGRALARLGEYRSPPAALGLARRYIASFPPGVLRLDEGRTVDDLSDGEMEDLLQKLSGSKRMQYMLRNTFVPTMVKAGLGQNVIPPSCEAYVDCRTVPGVDAEALMAELSGAIGDPEIEVELVKQSEGTESPPESELFDAVREAVASERPQAIVVPYLTQGGTDCKHFRPRGVVCYGHIPFELDDSEAERIHGSDERVSLENLRRGLRILFRIVLGTCLRQG